MTPHSRQELSSEAGTVLPCGKAYQHFLIEQLDSHMQTDCTFEKCMNAPVALPTTRSNIIFARVIGFARLDHLSSRTSKTLHPIEYVIRVAKKYLPF